jgi:four helix bundle protein
MDALRNLDVWKRACRLSVNVYLATQGCSDRGFRDQLTRSALSVPSNIAEGYERETTKERIRFLRIAKGSCGECWTQLLIGGEAGLLSPADAKPLSAEAEEVAKMLRGLIKHYEVKEDDALLPRYS